MIPHPTALQSPAVTLLPLETGHCDALWTLAQDPEIWHYFRTGPLSTRENLEAWIRYAIQLRERGIDYPFLILDAKSGQAAGSTRFRLLDPPNRSAEIGGSWLGQSFRGAGINRECKRLMLEYAFEHLQLIRVQFRTDIRNLRSRRAIEKLGATEEGIFRKDSIYPDGYQRSSVFYSILDTEWPELKRSRFCA